MGSLLSLSFFITKNMKSSTARGPGVRDAAGALRVSGADRKDHSRRKPGRSRPGRQFPARPTNRRRPAATPREARAASCAQRRSGRKDRLFRRQRSQSRRCTISAPILPTARSSAAASWRSAKSSARPTASSRARPTSSTPGGFTKVRNMLLDRSATILAGRQRHSAGLFRSERNGGCSRSAVMSGRSTYSGIPISPAWRSCSATPPRSISASATGGATTNRTCCWPRKARH